MLQRLFEEWAKKTPQAPALSWNGRSLTYAQLNARSNTISQAITGKHPLVALQCVHGPEAILGMLAILKAGKAYLPLDPQLPPQRLEAILAMAGHPPMLQATDLKVEGPGRPDSLAAAAGELMYVIHTSGTSGQPRGVQVTHANVAGLFPSCRDWLGFRPDQCWSWLHPLSFGFSVWEIWGALAHGGRLAIAHRGPVFDPELCWESWRQEQVSVASLTPSAFRLITQDLARRPPLDHLETIVFSGEPMVGEPLRRWFQHFRPEKPLLLNMYALTETAGEVACHPLEPADVDRTHSRIGRPLPGVDFRLVEGEIVIRGPMVAAGYLNEPELSKQRFIQLEGVSAYRTGDLARQLETGEYEYLGRRDGQLKVAGHRIEGGEIERHLRQIEGLTDVVVRLYEEQLVAYYMSSIPLAARELRNHLLQIMPAAVVPQRFQRVERLPLTTHGKLDESVLRGLGALTPMQEVVQAAWMDLLELEEVNLEDDFFDLGGHSLSAMRLIGMLRSHLNLNVTMRDLIDFPTLQSLAHRLQDLGPDPGEITEGMEPMHKVLEEAAQAVDEGGIPYAACLVKEGQIVCCVANRVLSDGDPTAHAEVLAIRQASQILGRRDLSGCTLYSSVEPCSMCLSACHWAGIGRVVYAANQSDEKRFGLAEVTLSSAELNRQLGGRIILEANLCRPQALALFERWLALNWPHPGQSLAAELLRLPQGLSGPTYGTIR